MCFNPESAETKKKKRNSISIFLLSTKCIFFFTLVQSYHLPQINWPDAIKKNVNPIIFNDNVLFALAIYKRFILKIVFFFCISNWKRSIRNAIRAIHFGKLYDFYHTLNGNASDLDAFKIGLEFKKKQNLKRTGMTINIH